MRYTENDIPNVPITAFLDSLGEKPVKAFEDLKLYYAPYRDDPEPMLVVDEKTNRWYDHATDETGNLHDLAALTARGQHRDFINEYIVKFLNENEKAKEMLAQSHKGIEPIVVNLDIKKVPLTDFMKALGKDVVGADGDLRIYDSPYDSNKGNIVVNIRNNTWRDTKSGANGGIYNLAYELTGSCNKSELNQYIAGEMNAFQKKEMQKEIEPPKPKSKLRL